MPKTLTSTLTRTTRTRGKASTDAQSSLWLVRTADPSSPELAGDVAQRIADAGGLRRIYCSPALDGRRTADALIQDLSRQAPPPTSLVDDRLRPPDLRILGSLALPTMAVGQREPFSFRAPGGESFADIARRLRSLLHETRRRGTAVALVTHEGVFQIACAVALGWPDDDVVRFVRQGVVGPWATATLHPHDPHFRLARLHRTQSPLV